MDRSNQKNPNKDLNERVSSSHGAGQVLLWPCDGVPVFFATSVEAAVIEDHGVTHLRYRVRR
jgi:hypothetical protein